MLTWWNADLVSAGLLILRIVAGVIWFAHGAQKVLGWFGGHGLKGTVQGYFKGALGIPEPLGYLGAFVEFFGGIFLIFGFLTRLSALGLLIMMIVAMFKVHVNIGFFMNWGTAAGRGEGYEFTLAMIGIALVLLITGPGLYAVDWLL